MNQEDEKIVVNFFTLFEFENDNFVVKLTEKTHTKQFLNIETFIGVEAEVKGVVSKFYNEIPIPNYYLFKEWKEEAAERVIFYLTAYKEKYKITDAVFNDIINSVEDDTLPFVLELIEREWETYLIAET